MYVEHKTAPVRPGIPGRNACTEQQFCQACWFLGYSVAPRDVCVVVLHAAMQMHWPCSHRTGHVRHAPCHKKSTRSSVTCRNGEAFHLREFEIDRCLMESDTSKMVVLLGRCAPPAHSSRTATHRHEGHNGHGDVDLKGRRAKQL